MTIFKIRALPAHDGDCFIISFGEENDVKNILVDGGRRKKVVNKLKEEFQYIASKNQKIDLMILTHIDDDHIQGLLKVFEKDEFDKSLIQKVWFNSKELLSLRFLGKEQEDEQLKINQNNDDNISFKQGISLGKLLKDLNLGNEILIHSNQKYHLGKATIKILSPNIEALKKLYLNWDKKYQEVNSDGIPISSSKENDYNKSIEELLQEKSKEDRAIVNGSSIAFSIEFMGKTMLMLGDSFPSVVTRSLREISKENTEINFDLIKVSHHGSKSNINEDFLNIINCSNFIISTNGSSHNLPNKETIVKISQKNKDKNKKTNFYFNYNDLYKKILTEDEIQLLKIKCIDDENISSNVLEVDLWNY